MPGWQPAGQAPDQLRMRFTWRALPAEAVRTAARPATNAGALWSEASACRSLACASRGVPCNMISFVCMFDDRLSALSSLVALYYSKTACPVVCSHLPPPLRSPHAYAAEARPRRGMDALRPMPVLARWMPQQCAGTWSSWCRWWVGESTECRAAREGLRQSHEADGNGRGWEYTDSTLYHALMGLDWDLSMAQRAEERPPPPSSTTV